MVGKEICNQLKEIRKKIAEANGIVFKTTECDFQGSCTGTCPACEAELQYLTQQIKEKKGRGEAVNLKIQAEVKKPLPQLPAELGPTEEELKEQQENESFFLGIEKNYCKELQREMEKELFKINITAFFDFIPMTSGLIAPIHSLDTEVRYIKKKEQGYTSYAMSVTKRVDEILKKIDKLNELNHFESCRRAELKYIDESVVLFHLEECAYVWEKEKRRTIDWEEYEERKKVALVITNNKLQEEEKDEITNEKKRTENFIQKHICKIAQRWGIKNYVLDQIYDRVDARIANEENK